MSRIDEPVDLGTVWEVANRVLDDHDDGGTCRACTAEDCPQTAWALVEVARGYARRDAAARR
jgi:hypothetical protein